MAESLLGKLGVLALGMGIGWAAWRLSGGGPIIRLSEFSGDGIDPRLRKVLHRNLIENRRPDDRMPYTVTAKNLSKQSGMDTWEVKDEMAKVVAKGQITKLNASTWMHQP